MQNFSEGEGQVQLRECDLVFIPSSFLKVFVVSHFCSRVDLIQFLFVRTNPGQAFEAICSGELHPPICIDFLGSFKVSKERDNTYLNRIAELEQEVRDRELDLKRFRDELNRANSRMETLLASLQTDLDSLVAVQRVLVPTELPQLSDFELSSKFIPSREMGGDYFDIVEQEDRFRFGALMASCGSHAASALLLSVLLKQTQRVGNAQDFISEIHAQVLKSKLDWSQMDLVYLVVDRRSFQLEVAFHGQLPLLWQQAASGQITSVKSDEKIYLNPRDRLILCSRGIYDALNASGESLGVGRLTRAVAEGPRAGVHELRNHILYELKKFQGQTAPLRDQTILILEVKERLIKLARRNGEDKTN